MTKATTSARRTLRIEANAIMTLASRIGIEFDDAVSAILATTGRVIVCGMGKSGIIGHKIAATFASTGTPSSHLHPGDAYHGDLGMVTPGDLFLAISNSGETEEVVKLLPFLTTNGNALISLTGNPKSTLALAAMIHLNTAVVEEACPLHLAPTASTTAALAMGDALAVAVMEARGFTPEDFARFHPGGALGRRLLLRVEDEMQTSSLPIVSPRISFGDIVTEFSKTKLGLVIVKDADTLAIVTDGDVRRAIERHGRDVFDLTAERLMTRNPATVQVGTRLEDAIALMDRRAISALLVLKGDSLVGVVRR